MAEPVRTSSGPPAAAPHVYVHVPFCATRCDYCAFATWTDRDDLHERYVAAVEAEARMVLGAGPPAATAFFGGGTPTRLAPDLLARVIAAVPTGRGAEVTVECNPDDVTTQLIDTCLDAGATRFSLGVQSTDATVLAGLGRTHDPAGVERAVGIVAASGARSWSLDLIIGGAGETDAAWARTVEEVLAFDPPHVSAYCLSVEPGTPLAADPARHPDDDDQARRYEHLDRRFTEAGLTWYELSNWARPGAASRHNQAYWDQSDYAGLGCAAHGHRAGRRAWNVRTPERYCERIEAGVSAEAGCEHLDEAARHQESLELAVRTSGGVPRAALNLDDAALDGLVEPVPSRPGRVRLTLAGRLLANEVAIRLRS